jgi:hypothetical protein
MKNFIKFIPFAVVPFLSHAEVQLVAGWNFGQFVGNGSPTTLGVDFTDVGSIPSNFTLTQRPGVGTSGYEKATDGLNTVFSAGTGVIYWDGTNGSDVWTMTGTVNDNGVTVDNNPENYSSINGQLVYNNDFNAGQIFNYQLRFNQSGTENDFALTVSTTGFYDYEPADYAQNNDENFSFAAYGSGSVEFFHQGNSLGVVTVGVEEERYTLNLPSGFYNQTSSTLIGRLSSSAQISFDNMVINAVPVPEPSVFASVAGLGALAFAAGRRRR